MKFNSMQSVQQDNFSSVKLHSSLCNPYSKALKCMRVHIQHCTIECDTYSSVCGDTAVCGLWNILLTVSKNNSHTSSTPGAHTRCRGVWYFNCVLSLFLFLKYLKFYYFLTSCFLSPSINKCSKFNLVHRK